MALEKLRIAFEEYTKASDGAIDDVKAKWLPFKAKLVD
jgi:hypothetical protein